MSNRRLLFVLAVALALAALLMLMSAGCAKRGGPSLARADLHIDLADGDLPVAQPLTKGEASTRIGSARGHLVEAKKNTGAAAADYAKAADRVKYFETNRWVSTALWLHWMFRFLLVGGVVYVIAAFAFRAWAGAGGGPIVGIVSGVLWGVLTGGLTLIKTFAGKVGEKSAGKKSVVLPEATANIAVAKAGEAQARGA